MLWLRWQGPPLEAASPPFSDWANPTIRGRTEKAVPYTRAMHGDVFSSSTFWLVCKARHNKKGLDR